MRLPRVCATRFRVPKIAAGRASGVKTLALLAWIIAICASTAEPARSDTRSAIATRAEVVKAGNSTALFKLRLSTGVVAEVFTLADPYRVIIDLPDVAFRLPEGTGSKGGGLVSQFRYGLFAAGKARIVIDTHGPVSIKRADMQNADTKGAVELTLTLVKTDAAQFGRGTGPQASSNANDDADSNPDAHKPRSGLPVVVIDPGHGGVDPGAVGGKGIYEKDIVLAVALALKSELEKSGRFKVSATRTDDVFVSLDDRLRLSRSADADLFVSLHADSLGDDSVADRIRGATVYTLSSRASDEQARLMAEKENRSDLIAGLAPVAAEHENDVANILIDLMKRETADFAADFSNVLVSHLRGAVPLSHKPRRSAAFKVLKQTRTPAVLIELGYLSNATDRKLLRSAAWQEKAALSIASSVTAYFAKRTAHANRP